MLTERGLNFLMNETKEVFEIDVLQITKAILKKWWLLLLFGLIGAVLMFSYTTLFVTPMYSSTAKMYINASSSSNIDMSGLSTARDLVATYAYLVKNTRMTLEEVAEKAKLDYSYEQLRSMVYVSSGGSTEFLEITVSAPNPEDACLIANTIMVVLPGRAAATNLNSTISAADWATVSSVPTSPNVTKNMTLGFVVGLVLAALLAALKEILDDKVQSENWLKQTFKNDIPLLATIPSTDHGRRYDRYSRYSNYYRHYTTSRKTDNK